jgi:hypothetical protein
LLAISCIASLGVSMGSSCTAARKTFE